MKQISDSDYRQAFLLLSFLSKTSGLSVREKEAARKAKLLIRKWNKKSGDGE